MSKLIPITCEVASSSTRHSKAYYQLARQMFAKAVKLDPLYARAYAGIADCDSFLFLHYHVEDVAIDGYF